MESNPVENRVFRDIVREGEIHHATGDELMALMDRILSSRRHRIYDDLVRPVVRVSHDGSLGWVIAQVRAEGVRLDDEGKESGPLEFTSAWISTFEKVEGDWKQVGNVSNFRSGRK